MDSAARGCVIISGIFLGSGLLYLSKEAAGSACLAAYNERMKAGDPGFDFVTELETLDDTECADAKIYGMKPSSLLSVMATASGLMTASTMPLAGAVVDHTKYRWHAGAVSAFLLCFINFIQMFIGSSTWFFCAILQVFASYTYVFHSVVQYAYLPELTNSSKELAKMAASFNLWQFLAETLYLMVVVALGIGLGLDDVGTAQISQFLVVLICLFFLGYSWTYLFGHRPALHEIESGDSLLNVGFKRMSSTFRELRGEYPDVRTFLLGMAFSEAAASAFATIAVTYLVEVLGMKSQETGIVFMCTLLFAVPGSILCKKLTAKIGPYKSYQYALIWWGVVTCVAPLFMHKPEQSTNAYFFGILWGIGFGWIYPTQRTCYCELIPGGQESELMGLYIFAGQIIVWFPPLLFTTLNEKGIGMEVGLGLCCGFFFFIALFIMRFVDYEAGTAKALETRDKRKMGEGATNGEDDSDDDDVESPTSGLGPGMKPKPDNSSNML